MRNILKEKSISLKLSIGNILIVIVLLLIGACGSDRKQETRETDKTQISVQVSIYDSWSTTQFENIKVVYPPNHLFADTMNDYAILYKTVLRRHAQFFRMPEPTDSIVMLYMTGFGQGKELTQSEFPIIRGDSVFYWPGNRFGVLAAKYMLYRWTNSEPKYKFLFNGIMRLLDASGRDYHSMTFAFIDSNKFISLENLITDDMIDYNWEAYQSAEAASFVDYFVYKYGIDNFKLMYESQSQFDSTTQTICQMNLKDLQHDWLKIVGQVVKQNSDKK